MNTQTVKIENGTITLPEEIQKDWREAEVLVFPNNDTLIVKKVSRPLKKLSDLADRTVSPAMSSREIDQEIQAYRQNK